MAKKGPKKEDFYWPLGLLSYTEEIRTNFPTEAELIGVITILWNHHERHLRDLFVNLLKAPSTEFAEAIWHRQPTHQAKRNLLVLGMEHAGLPEDHRKLLANIIEKTKTFADRRNDLMHGEYVVHGRSEKLFARIRSPNSKQEARYQKNSEKDLLRALGELEALMLETSGTIITLFHADLQAEVSAFAKAWLAERKLQQPENPQTDFPPQTVRRRRAPAQKPPPESSGE